MNRALLVMTVLALAACSKEAPSMKNDMVVAPVGKSGGADDGIKPITRPTPVIGKGGIPDDSIKPVVVQKPAPPSLGGVPDDGVKPVPRK